jgi:transcriptional regulator with XRE-family HTH domain
MSSVVDALRRSRHARGMSQHEVALAMGTTQSAVARLEGGRVDPKLGTVEAYAAAVGSRLSLSSLTLSAACADAARDVLDRGDHDGALRAVIELFNALLGAVAPEEELRIEPGSTGSPQWDAAIAAACERAARLRGVPIPGWTAAPARRLDRAWFPVEEITGRTSAGLQCLALASSPPEFAARGVFLDAASLASA